MTPGILLSRSTTGQSPQIQAARNDQLIRCFGIGSFETSTVVPTRYRAKTSPRTRYERSRNLLERKRPRRQYPRTRADVQTATAVHPCIPGSCGQLGSRSIAA